MMTDANHIMHSIPFGNDKRHIYMNHERQNMIVKFDLERMKDEPDMADEHIC